MSERADMLVLDTGVTGDAPEVTATSSPPQLAEPSSCLHTQYHQRRSGHKYSPHVLLSHGRRHGWQAHQEHQETQFGFPDIVNAFQHVLTGRSRHYIHIAHEGALKHLGWVWLHSRSWPLSPESRQLLVDTIRGMQVCHLRV